MPAPLPCNSPVLSVIYCPDGHGPMSLVRFGRCHPDRDGQDVNDDYECPRCKRRANLRMMLPMR